MTTNNHHYPETELIITDKNKVYHLDLGPEEIADTVLLVGDPGRVQQISERFSSIEHKVSHREFVTHTGIYKGKRLTVLSTGIGTDNIDIVLNELDAAVNIDLKNRKTLPVSKSLSLIRLGTCGALQADIPVNGIIISEFGLGLDGLMNFYAKTEEVFHDDISNEFIKHTGWNNRLPFPYCVKGDDDLFQLFAKDNYSGITATAPGFYGPQGRKLRLLPIHEDLNDHLTSFTYKNHRITNFEMETSALYGLGKMLGHKCVTACVVIANRVRKEFTTDPKKSVNHLLDTCLERLTP